MQPQRHVGVFGGVSGRFFDRHAVHRDLADPFADQLFDRYRRIVQQRAGEVIHAVPGFGVQQVVDNHRVVKHTAHLGAGAAQHHDVEFDVLPDFSDSLVFENRA